VHNRCKRLGGKGVFRLDKGALRLSVCGRGEGRLSCIEGGTQRGKDVTKGSCRLGGKEKKYPLSKEGKKRRVR